MNYKNIGLRVLQEFSESKKDMTLGEILYSVLREKNSGISTLLDIKNISDEKLYSAIEKAKQFEEE